MKNLSLKMVVIYSIVLFVCASLAGCIFSKNYYKDDQEDTMTEWVLESITPGYTYTEQRWIDGNGVAHRIKADLCTINYKVGHKMCYPTRR